MEKLPQATSSGRQKALSIHQEILNLLKIRSQDRDHRIFRRIGELLTEFRDNNYCHYLGHENFKQYVKADLKGKVEYSYATRYIKIYKFFKEHTDYPDEWLDNIKLGNLYSLVEKAQKGEVKPSLWRRANTLTFQELRTELGFPTGKLPPISDDDSSLHTKIKSIIKEIGDMLGKYTKTEYPCSTNISHDEYPHAQHHPCDVVWKDYAQAREATHAFEVQHGGDLDHALGTLTQARKNLNARPFLIITSSDKDAIFWHAQQRHPHIAKILTVFTKKEIQRLYKTLAVVREDLNRLTKP